jgi:hypothetical protein
MCTTGVIAGIDLDEKWKKDVLQFELPSEARYLPWFAAEN